MAGVFYCSPYNSTHFTRCCRVAICDDQRKCPKCNEYVYPYDNRMSEEEMREYDSYFGHKAKIARDRYARQGGLYG